MDGKFKKFQPIYINTLKTEPFAAGKRNNECLNFFSSLTPHYFPDDVGSTLSKFQLTIIKLY